MKNLLFIIFVLFLMSCCESHAQKVTFILFSDLGAQSDKVYKAEGKLIMGDIADAIGLIYNVKLIKLCPCEDKDMLLLKHGFYYLEFDDLFHKGTYIELVRMFSGTEQNFCESYSLGMNKDALESLEKHKVMLSN